MLDGIPWDCTNMYEYTVAGTKSPEPGRKFALAGTPDRTTHTSSFPWDPWSGTWDIVAESIQGVSQSISSSLGWDATGWAQSCFFQGASMDIAWPSSLPPRVNANLCS